MKKIFDKRVSDAKTEPTVIDNDGAIPVSQIVEIIVKGKDLLNF